MALLLGPMPEKVQAFVIRLVADAQRCLQEISERPNGFLLTGGPTGSSYLDADGQVWNFCVWDDSIELIEDGPRKVGLIALVAERVPELREWLPRRSELSTDCQVCRQSGRLQPPLPPIQCPNCFGLGWLPE